MEQEYSPEKWAINDVDNALIYSEETAFNLARVFGENKNANARRIVACVNACESIPTEALELIPNFAKHTSEELDRLRAQNAELSKILTLALQDLDLQFAKIQPLTPGNPFFGMKIEELPEKPEWAAMARDALNPATISDSEPDPTESYREHKDCIDLAEQPTPYDP